MTRSAAILAAIVARLQGSATLDGWRIETRTAVADLASVATLPDPGKAGAVAVALVSGSPSLSWSDRLATTGRPVATRGIVLAVVLPPLPTASGTADPKALAAARESLSLSNVLAAVMGADPTLSGRCLPLDVARFELVELEQPATNGRPPTSPRRVYLAGLSARWLATPSDPMTL